MLAMGDRGESVPLMSRAGGEDGHAGSQMSICVESEEEWEEDMEEEEDDSQDKLLFADEKKRGTSLILNDAALMVLHFLQIYAVVQSMALRWPWPLNWIEGMKYMFLFNLDVWEFAKVTSNGTYLSVQGYFTPSASMPLLYWHILVAWAGFLSIAFMAYVITYAILTYRKRPALMLQIAYLHRVYIILAQVICLPLGTVLARVFHCTDDSVMDVDNNQVCFQGMHWVYMGPAIFVILLFYITFPAWMIRRTRVEMLNMTTDRHEGYLQLKETEYVQGLDILYVVGGFHIFSSFKKHGSHLRATVFFMALILFIFYAAFFRNEFLQILLVTILFSSMFTAFIVIRPYRVSSFNVVLALAYLCLLFVGMLGCLKTSVDAYTMRSVYMTPQYIYYELLAIHGFWLVCTVIFLFYLILRHFGCCNRCCAFPLWPSMTSQGLYRLSPETRKYVRAVLKGRTLVEHILKMPAMFAPVHELARQIQIINAYCREAEHLQDPIHDTLWDLLDELIDAHGRIAPRSLFAESVKESIRHTASEFMKMIPTFKRRLAQREYDFILMTPLKRRMLLKMYCMGVFLNGRRHKLEFEQLTRPGMKKVWNKARDEEEYSDDGYYEDMYPEAETSPQYRPVTSLSLGAISNDVLDDEMAMEEVEQWTKDHPLSRKGPGNRPFVQDDVALILNDDGLDDDISRIFDNIPSMPGSVEPTDKDESREVTFESAIHDSHVDTGEDTGEDTTAELITPENVDEMLETGMLAPEDARPGLAALRPGTAGSRPGSASRATPQVDLDADLMRGTPLPGQVPAFTEDQEAADASQTEQSV